MEKRIFFEQIKTLVIDKLEKIRRNESVKISLEEKDVLADLYHEVVPYAQMNMTCAPCVKQYMAILESHYEREYPKWITSQIVPELINNEETVVEQVAEKALNKSSKKKRN